MKLKLTCAIICVGLTHPMPGLPQPDSQAALIESISVDTIRQHLNILGSDSPGGRGTGTPGAQTFIPNQEISFYSLN